MHKKIVEENNNFSTDLVHLARLGLAGRRQDILMMLRRLIKKTQKVDPKLSKQLGELLFESPTNSNPVRNNQTESIPVDNDSRLHLARVEFPAIPAVEPIWSESLARSLNQVIEERASEKELTAVGLHPTKSLLLTGPPGVGKSLTATWIASKLDRPLVILDLSAVMSSYLGRTGNNLRQVLDYAKSIECVLLLDEFDAIAKRRDDGGEIGELKRLVNVLLQEIDDFPSTGILVAATNHPDLLDPAIWRRFEMVLEFPMPTEKQTKSAIKEFIDSGEDIENLVEILSFCFRGSSFSDIQRFIQLAKKESVVKKIPLRESVKSIIQQFAANLSKQEKLILAKNLARWGYGQREISNLIGISRESIRKYAKGGEELNGNQI